MRKLISLSLGIFLVFGLFAGIGIIFGCGSCDSSCDCSNSKCEFQSLLTSNPLTVWYHEGKVSKSYMFGAIYSYPKPYIFTDSDCIHYSSSDCCKRCSYPCNCGLLGCSTCYYCCGDDYRCSYPTTTCQSWQTCYEASCGSGGDGCDCKEEYCKGWCRENSPVYDGLAGCSAASDGDWVIPSFQKPPEYILNTDPHSASMGGGCYCNYYEIKNYHECDSINIKDSHPCHSGNCAPDFINGGDYCCPPGQCAHLNLDTDILNGLPRNNNLRDSVDPDLYCYSNGAVIQYQGDSLKCNDGVWNFVTGGINDFKDNCGKTIYNFPLFFNNYPIYPNPDNPYLGYKNSYIVHPLSFPGETKDVLVYIAPNKDFVNIQISKTFFDSGVVGSGANKLIQRYTDSATVKFSLSEDVQGEVFDYYIGCYTPNGYECNYAFDDCWSNSYCSQDNPSSTANEDINEYKYYCCPKGTCAHKESGVEASCYEEGGHELNINEELCLWECKDEIWGKRDEGEICFRDCDCADLDNINKELSCKITLYNKTDKICCPESKCGLKTGVCVEENGVAQSGEYKNCVCQDGAWHCKNILVEDKNSRILFSESRNTYKTTLKLNTHLDKPAKINLRVFFDKKNYDGVINIFGTGDCSINKNIVIEEVNDVFEDEILSGDYTCELEINTSGLLEGQYFFYTGTALILEYTTFDLNIP